MPVSTRVIRVIDGEYTLELELEVESADELIPELTKTEFGRKIAYLLAKMLPQVPEIQTEDQKAMAEAEEQRIKEYEEKIREEGRAEIRNKYYGLEYAEIRKRATEEAEERIRRKYLDYINKKVIKVRTIPDDEDGCFGHFNESDAKCGRCASRAECLKETGIRKRMNQVQEQALDEVTTIYTNAKDRSMM